MDNHDSNTRKEDEYRDHVDAEYDEIHGKKNYRELYYGFSEKGKKVRVNPYLALGFESLCITENGF